MLRRKLEQCQKGAKDITGNKACHILYGVGTQSMALGMKNFDAIVFLQQVKNGSPMTLKDIAAAFCIIVLDKSGDGGDKIARIDCHNSKPEDLPAKRVSSIQR